MSVPYVVLSKADIRAIFSPYVLEGWNRFYERFLDSAGYAAVSAVGFNTNRTKAIVYIAHHYQALGGQYAYYLLQKNQRLLAGGAGSWCGHVSHDGMS